MCRISLAGVSMLVLLVTVVLRAQDAPTTAPAEGIIDVTDRNAIGRAMERQDDVIVEGVVERAEWSRTGKVMNIDFKGAEGGLLAVAFERIRKQLDEGFGGDVAKTLTGARVRLKGTVKPYGGRVPEMKGRPQIVIEFPQQITILELAPVTPPPSSSLSPSETSGQG